ncbi:MAG: hypothetical protein GX644_05435 [Limnobacter sp.]|nr:hypothetical protein [Limnobacter sp.]
MAGSTLDITGEEPPVVDRGHGTKALGPSDSSDSGSDIAGGSGTTIDVDPGLDQGTNADPDGGGTRTAGPDIGDPELDGDSDRYGTGERGAAGRDSVTADSAETWVDTVKPMPGEGSPAERTIPPTPPIDESELDIAPENDERQDPSEEEPVDRSRPDDPRD